MCITEKVFFPRHDTTLYIVFKEFSSMLFSQQKIKWYQTQWGCWRGWKEFPLSLRSQHSLSSFGSCSERVQQTDGPATQFCESAELKSFQQTKQFQKDRFSIFAGHPKSNICDEWNEWNLIDKNHKNTAFNLGFVSNFAPSLLTSVHCEVNRNKQSAAHPSLPAFSFV